MTTSLPATSAGVNRVNCIGIAVRDLDRALRFYEVLTGIRATPPRWIASRRPTAGRAAGAPLIRLATLHLSNLNIDLLQDDAPPAPAADHGRSPAGTMHLCFEVDSLDAVLDRMSEVGLELIGRRDAYEADHLADDVNGTSIAYFEDPDGTRLGLIHPSGTFRRFKDVWPT